MSKPNRTTFLALVVLEQAIRRRQQGGPLRPPEHGVRLALAYLYSITLTKNREPFDQLWRTLTGNDADMKARSPTTWSDTLFASICRAVDVQQDIDLTAALARARGDLARSE